MPRAVFGVPITHNGDPLTHPPFLWYCWTFTTLHHENILCKLFAPTPLPGNLRCFEVLSNHIFSSRFRLIFIDLKIFQAFYFIHASQFTFATLLYIIKWLIPSFCSNHFTWKALNLLPQHWLMHHFFPPVVILIFGQSHSSRLHHRRCQKDTLFPGGNN